MLQDTKVQKQAKQTREKKKNKEDNPSKPQKKNQLKRLLWSNRTPNHTNSKTSNTQTFPVSIVKEAKRKIKVQTSESKSRERETEPKISIIWKNKFQLRKYISHASKNYQNFIIDGEGNLSESDGIQRGSLKG